MHSTLIEYMKIECEGIEICVCIEIIPLLVIIS